MSSRFTLLTAFMLLFHCAQAASPLEQALLQAVRDAHFDQLIDFGPANEDRDIKPGSAQRIAHPPNVDLAVIQLDAAGRAVACANVLLSRDYPQGVVVPVTLDDGAANVRFLRWDIDRWNGGAFAPGTNQPHTPKGWTNLPALTEADAIIPGRTNAPLQFMAPYPASLFKLMVAFQVFRAVDAGEITLTNAVTYRNGDAKPETRHLLAWLDPMITVSDNHATKALIQWLHQQRRIETLNREFRELGLGTLQLNGTRAEDGYGWGPGRFHMTAFDTARLLWLIEGSGGELWRRPDGKPVTAQFLSAESRACLNQLLHDQALHEALSTTCLFGAPEVRPGIPAIIADRWINPTNGHVIAHDIDFGRDVRPALAQAEVTFAHKTGLTYNYASDAGIVTSLPGKPFRRYIIAFLANTGYRYTDEAFANRARGPYADKVSPIAYTQRIPALGKAVDNALIRLSSNAGK
jgi:beta-lactamase class A